MHFSGNRVPPFSSNIPIKSCGTLNKGYLYLIWFESNFVWGKLYSFILLMHPSIIMLSGLPKAIIPLFKNKISPDIFSMFYVIYWDDWAKGT